MTLAALIGVAVCVGVYVGIAYGEASRRVDDQINRFFRGER